MDDNLLNGKVRQYHSRLSTDLHTLENHAGGILSSQNFSGGIYDVTAYGAVGDGVTDSSDAINAAISASTEGSVIIFPAGVYLINKTIRLKSNRAYTGAGWGTVLKQKNGANLMQMVEVGPYGTVKNILIRDLHLDGNRSYNTSGHGLYLKDVQHSVLEGIIVQHCPQTGIFFDGTSFDFGTSSNTCHVVRSWTYNNGGYGVYLSDKCGDIHIDGGDHGYNDFTNIFLHCGSSSVQNAVAWGSKGGSGIEVHGISNQVVNCHIEGNNKHGIVVANSHATIVANKIYANAYTQANFGKYDGIYVNGSPAMPVVNTSIMANNIYSALTFHDYDPAAYYRYAIALDTNVSESTIAGNSLKHIGKNVEIDATKDAIYGLKDGDMYNGVLYILSTTRPAKLLAGEMAYETDTRQYVFYDQYTAEWSAMSRINGNSKVGSVHVAPNQKTASVQFPTPLANTSYTISLATSWDAHAYYTNKTVSGFTLHTSAVAPADGGFIDWTATLRM